MTLTEHYYPFKWIFTTTSPSFSGSTSAVPLRICPRKQDTHLRLLNQIPPPGIHYDQAQDFAFLHIAQRRSKLLPTLASGKGEK